MGILIRTVALVLGLAVLGIPILLALFVSGVEPSRPINPSWFASFVVSGVTSAFGYFAITFFAKSLAGAHWSIRLILACLVAIPVSDALLLATQTGAPEVAALCALLVFVTLWLVSACVWPAWLKRTHAQPK